MIIYIVSATEQEIQPLLNFLSKTCREKKKFLYQFNQYQIHILIHGMGILNTLFHLTDVGKCDLIIQAGIAGSFLKKIKNGTVVNVQKDKLGDLGAEDHDLFLDCKDLGFTEINPYYDPNGWLTNPCTSSLQNVQAITLNCCSGNAATIALRKKKYKPQIETMEGAAFHLFALKKNIPFYQWRAISNFIEPRNKNNWNIKLAITNLNNYLINYLQEIHGIKNSD
jgi:futalosine hydrolase